MFKSWKDYSRFAVEVAYSRRFIWSPDTSSFLAAIRESTPKQVFEIGPEDEFWRAVNVITEPQGLAEAVVGIVRPCPDDRIKPLRMKAHEGRVNPKGIPCLYVATDPATAVSETRPAMGQCLTLARLMPLRTLRLVNCSTKSAPVYEQEPSPEERENAVWAHMNKAFSQPVNRSDDSADYAPTQLLAEMFKDMGYDGVAYRSAFGEDGFNVAFFNPDDLRIDGRWVYKVTDISHKIEVVL